MATKRAERSGWAPSRTSGSARHNDSVRRILAGSRTGASETTDRKSGRPRTDPTQPPDWPGAHLQSGRWPSVRYKPGLALTIRAIRYRHLQLGKHPSWDDHADDLAICRDEAGSYGVTPVDELDIDQFADSHSRRNGLFIRHGWLPHAEQISCTASTIPHEIVRCEAMMTSLRQRVVSAANSFGRSMSDFWIEELLRKNPDIVTADAEVTALLRRLRVLHQEGQDKSQTAGLLVTKLKRLFRPRDQRDCNIQRVGERD
ncbi:hypothetical protein AU375_03062 [Methylobacterium radiotolerans]|nr:hypothetical protein AU375_03062 [Methylobacterium radiotolerans]